MAYNWQAYIISSQNNIYINAVFWLDIKLLGEYVICKSPARNVRPNESDSVVFSRTSTGI